MELKYFRTFFLFFALLTLTALDGQDLVNSTNVAYVNTATNGTAVAQKVFLLKRLVRSGVGYLQIVEDDVVFLQIVEDDVVFLKRLREKDIKMRLLTLNNKKNVQFLKNTVLLKSIVEDDVVFLESIVEDDVVFLKSIVEDDVVSLKIVEDDVVFLKSKDNTNSLKPTNSNKIKTNQIETHTQDSLKQDARLALRAHRRDSVKRSNAIQHWSVGLNVGAENAVVPFIAYKLGVKVGATNLLGVDLAYKFRSHWTVRLGFGYRDYEKNNFRYDITTKDPTGSDITKSVSVSVGAHFSNINGLLEYGVGPKGRFRLIAGAAVFPQKKLTVSGELLTNVQLNAVSLQPSDLGSGGIEVSFAQKVSPYFGFGIGRATPRRRLNLSLDFGAYYMGDYRVKVNINQGVILKETETNGPILERNLNAKTINKIWPTGNLRLAYRLR